ncbi:MAG: type I-B CRISPR-associated endonuclease Cas1b [Candidatus Poribacteria bacterium]|nr:type I-B CRISPR-associated endonuclease Cas1b [Candidatus Poribacteria bacterium]
MSRNYYITQPGRLRRKDNTLYLEPEEAPRVPIPVEDIDALYLYGELDLNTRLLNFLTQKHIPFHVFNYYGYYAGSYYPREYLNSGSLLVKQVQHYEKSTKRMALAQEFVASAVFNMLRILRYHTNRGKDCTTQIESIETILSESSTAKNTNELMGYEGIIRDTYYTAFNTILTLKTPFQKRVRRPPDNPINAVISFGNSMMYTACLTEVYRTQLNPTISFLHEPGDRRFSLSLDLAEIFKPLIVDRIIFRLFNRQQLNESKHFETNIDGCYLNEKGRKLFIAAFDEQLKQTVSHRKLKRHVSYQRLIRLEYYKLIKHLVGMETYQALRPWW